MAPIGQKGVLLLAGMLNVTPLVAVTDTTTTTVTMNCRYKALLRVLTLTCCKLQSKPGWGLPSKRSDG